MPVSLQLIFYGNVADNHLIKETCFIVFIIVNQLWILAEKLANLSSRVIKL